MSQPRERACPCLWCQRETWEPDAVCGACKKRCAVCGTRSDNRWCSEKCFRADEGEAAYRRAEDFMERSA